MGIQSNIVCSIAWWIRGNTPLVNVQHNQWQHHFISFTRRACTKTVVMAAAVSGYFFVASEVVTVTQQWTNSRQTHYFYISSLWVASIIQNTSIQLPLLQTQYSPYVSGYLPLLHARFRICCKFVLNWSHPIHWTFCRPPAFGHVVIGQMVGLIVMYQENLLTPLDLPFEAWIDLTLHCLLLTLMPQVTLQLEIVQNYANHIPKLGSPEGETPGELIWDNLLGVKLDRVWSGGSIGRDEWKCSDWSECHWGTIYFVAHHVQYPFIIFLQDGNQMFVVRITDRYRWGIAFIDVIEVNWCRSVVK